MAKHMTMDARKGMAHGLERRLTFAQMAKMFGRAVSAVRFPVAHEKLADNIVHALLRIIRELAVNARRHGQAVHIRVAGCLDGQRLRCAVSDDGN